MSTSEILTTDHAKKLKEYQPQKKGKKGVSSFKQIEAEKLFRCVDAGVDLLLFLK